LKLPSGGYPLAACNNQPVLREFACISPLAIADNFRRLCARIDDAAEYRRRPMQNQIEKPAAGFPARAFEFLR
jgi:hypothetical protein